MKQATLKKLMRNVESWGDEFTPACACGCGEPVRHDAARSVNKYVNRVHQRWHQGGDPTKARASIKKIDIEGFRQAVRNIQAKRSWTLRQTAEAGGCSLDHLSEVMYSKDRVFVTHEFVELFFRRMAGVSAKPSVWQMRQREIAEERYRETDAETIPRSRLHGLRDR